MPGQPLAAPTAETSQGPDASCRATSYPYPREIEEFLRTHPVIADVQVIGVPDVKYGEQVCAWVRLREGMSVTTEEIQAFCRGRIATYKIPRYIRITGDFPVTVTGKVQKFRMLVGMTP